MGRWSLLRTRAATEYPGRRQVFEWTESRLPLNFDLAGKSYPAIERTVTADQIAEYAAASGDANPAYLPGPDQVAPPVFSVVPGFSEVGRVVGDPELGVENPLMIVHGEQEFVYHRPIRAGDELVLSPSLESVEDKGKGATFVVKVAMTSPSGDAIVDQRATIFVRGGGSGEARERPSRDVPAAEPGPVAATFVRHVADDMPARYAAASGDHNPVHLDDAVANAVGLPGRINHGLGTLSLVAGGLVDEIAGGEASRLKRMAVRFTDMVFPGSDVTTTVREAGAGAYRFETLRADGAAVMVGTVELTR